MYMFSWQSNALRNYSSGDIVVMAYDLEAARIKVMAYATDWYRAAYSWKDIYNDEDDKEDYTRFLDELMKDISAEPSITNVLFIQGGE